MGNANDYLARFPNDFRPQVQEYLDYVAERLVTNKRRETFGYYHEVIGRVLGSAHLQILQRPSKQAGKKPITSVLVRIETIDNVTPENSSQVTTFEASIDHIRELYEIIGVLLREYERIQGDDR